MQGDEMLTVEQVAQRLKLNEETIRRWLRQKKIRGVLLGSNRGGYRIPESELRRILGLSPDVEVP